MRAGNLIFALWLLIATTGRAQFESFDASKVASAARSQVGVTRGYDPSYQKLTYPSGDVPMQTGVCSDVVIRALRAQSVDLQKEVHEDMVVNFSKYPRRWKLTQPDPNIDHRRVLNLMTYFKRRGFEVGKSWGKSKYLAGDIVAWDLGNGITHIGVLSDRTNPKGEPLVIHNIGRGVQEEDLLFGYEILGHYRIRKTEVKT
jgi:uncharacterized protein